MCETQQSEGMTFERAIELLKGLKNEFDEGAYYSLRVCSEELLDIIELLKTTAEQAPTLKPGDIVYRLRKNYAVLGGVSLGIEEGEVNTIVEHTFKDEYFVKYYVNFDGFYSEIVEKDLGVTIFLTKDEAEARYREAINGTCL